MEQSREEAWADFLMSDEEFDNLEENKEYRIVAGSFGAPIPTRLPIVDKDKIERFNKSTKTEPWWVRLWNWIIND